MKNKKGFVIFMLWLILSTLLLLTTYDLKINVIGLFVAISYPIYLIIHRNREEKRKKQYGI
jgi:hypothetical protein